MKIHTLYFTIILVFSFGCKKSKEKRSDIIFKVNPSLVTSEVVDSLIGVSYKVPIGFNKIALDKWSSNKLSILDSITSLTVKHKSLFFDRNNQSLIVFSEVVKPTITKEADLALQEFCKKSIWSTANRANFRSNGLQFHQFVLANTKHTVFKLLFKTNKSIEINYIVPKEHYNIDFAQKLESSIGSIKKINY